MGNRVGVENDDVVKVGADASEVFDDLVDSLDEPPWRGTAALRHDEAFEKPIGCANGVRGVVSISMVIWWNEGTGSNRENIRLFPRESRTSSTRGMASCPRELIALSFL